MTDDDFFTFYEKHRNTTRFDCQKISPCNFGDYDREIVWISPPRKGALKGVIISRDPTTGFIEAYKNAIKKTDNECRKDLMSNKGVPVHTIIRRIEKVCQSEKIPFLGDTLSNFLLKNCYWTHLLKCFTYSGREKEIVSKSFREAKLDGCVENCGKQWLCRELEKIPKLSDVRVIILLGADVTKFVYRNLLHENGKNWREAKKYNNCPIIPLPHPSYANGKEWTKPYLPSLLENIRKINELCNEGE